MPHSLAKTGLRRPASKGKHRPLLYIFQKKWIQKVLPFHKAHFILKIRLVYSGNVNIIGPDGVNPHLISTCAAELAPPLIFKMCLARSS